MIEVNSLNILLIAIGILLMSTPFIVVTWYAIWDSGVYEAIVAWAVTLVILAAIGIGYFLISLGMTG